MSDEKTINGMKRPELIKLINDVILDINSINASVKKITEVEKIALNSGEKINGGGGILEQIQEADTEIDAKLQTIREAYEEVIGDEDNEEGTAIKQQLDNLISIFEEDKKRIEAFKIKIFGSITKDVNGVVTASTKGLDKEFEEFIKNGKEKYSDLISDIESKLLPGATSVELALVFSTKVTEFKESTRFWTNLLIWILAAITFYFWLDLLLNPVIATEYKDVWIHLLSKIPLLGFSIWLIKTISDRRAESKKLEESYKHKEIMARSYMGYKKAIQDLETEDTKLLEKHMDNLLSAINKDSSKSLNSEGANHPFLTTISNLFSKRIRAEKEE